MKRTSADNLPRAGKRLAVSLLWDCNQRCPFCAKGPPPPGIKSRLSFGEAVTVLRAGRRDGCDFLSLDGGEPSIHPDLARLTVKALELGYLSVNILTNATGLAGNALLHALPAGAGNRVTFCVSLHSQLPQVSDKLTGSPGGFLKTLEGIRAARDAGFPFSLYHVITTLNWRAVPAYAAFVAKNFPETLAVTFSYIFPAQHLRAGLDLYPRISPTSPQLAKGARLLLSRGIRVELSACGMIPLCFARGNERILLNASMEKRFMTFDTMKMEPLPFLDSGFNRRNKTKAPRCADCFINRACGGIWNFYAARFGLSELRPFKAAYFRQLPGSGEAALDLLSCAGTQAPEARALTSLISLRYRGFSNLSLLNENALRGKAQLIRDLAREAGFKLARAAPRAASPGQKPK